MSITTQVIVLFIVVLVGVYCRRKDYFNDATIRGVTQLVINITVPCLMISSMQKPFDATVLFNFVATMLATAVFISCALGAGLLIFRSRPHARRAVLVNICAFTNCGFMGYPIILAVNPDWMIYAVAYNITNTFLTWTFGIALFQGKESISLRRVLLNPNIIASVIGFALFLFNITLPQVLGEVMDMLGGLTTPLTMLLIGTRVCGIRLSSLKEKDYHLIAALRLLAFPLAAWAITRVLPLAPEVGGVLFLLTAMPAGSIVAMQAELYGGDTTFVSRAIAYTTLLSLLSVPVMSALL